MSKIICDVCGTAFPETAAQCPICGSAKSADARTVNGNKTAADGAENSGYKFVKGGRFSKSNVRKRNKEMQARQNQPEYDGNGGEGEEKSNKGLLILVLILLAAVVAVVLYIILKFFVPFGAPDNTDPTDDTNPSTAASTAEPTESESAPTDDTGEPTEDTDPTDTTVPCTGLRLPVTQIKLTEPGSSVVIEVQRSPVDTTDAASFVSSNPSVATVDAQGNVTAVGEGDAVITVTCGAFHVDCHVSVEYATEPTTEPTEPSTEPSTEPEPEFELNRDDITMSYEGETWNLYNGSLPLNQIEWTSDDESVATIERGTVTAVGPGRTEVHGEYNGTKVSCIIRCNWTVEEPTEEPTEPTEGELEPGIYVLHINGREPSAQYGPDVSIGVGESFELTVVSPSGQIVSVNWTADTAGIVSVSGNTITGSAVGNTYVSVTINDQVISCMVRVK